MAIGLGDEAAGQGEAPSALFGQAARRLTQLTLVTAAVLGLAMPPSIPRWYFVHQDIALFAVQLLALWWLPAWSRPRPRPRPCRS